MITELKKRSGSCKGFKSHCKNALSLNVYRQLPSEIRRRVVWKLVRLLYKYSNFVYLLDFIFSRRCLWRIRSSGKWHCVIYFKFTEVSASACYVLYLLFDSEDGGSKSLRNVAKLLLNNEVSFPRSWYSWYI
jgi:hypothetical protein